jgi:hypothetical protein
MLSPVVVFIFGPCRAVEDLAFEYTLNLNYLKFKGVLFFGMAGLIGVKVGWGAGVGEDCSRRGGI